MIVVERPRVGPQKDFSREGVGHALDGRHGGLAPDPQLLLIWVNGGHEVKVGDFEGQAQGGAFQSLLLDGFHRKIPDQEGVFNLEPERVRFLITNSAKATAQHCSAQ